MFYNGSIKDVINPESLALIVIYHVPVTVKITRVTLKMEHVQHANLDGREQLV